MNWATILAEVQDIVTGLNADRVARSLCKILGKLRQERAFFNQTWHTVTLVAGTDEYALNPLSGYTLNDAIGDPITRPVLEVQEAWVDQVGGGARYRLKRRSFWELERMSSDSTITGQPTVFSVMAEKIKLYAIPDAAYPMTLALLVDVGTPVYRISAGAWVFETDDGTALTANSTYESPWMLHAGSAVVAFVAADLLATHAGEVELGRVEALLQQAQAYLDDSRTLTSGQEAADQIQPYYGG